MGPISVLSIIDATGKVIKVLKKYIPSVRDAPHELQRILIETSATEAVLGNLSFLLECSDKRGRCTT
ncbi:hypothetical protein B0T26DRAFT_714869 [Lasiosphaeria miniovina]|uniref:Uncharacterized protein n=1 Tax=Lasiosphaeria miniovina TaxID=1954250 RepID=A0AA40ABF2_9PEZI|nr:uncharacterized protein B0T26DRAFT_714869 [Lasiosphaeria miniovina]KAK0712645.1 hypothetical protein B0T26DRAFT_714869 [Lasiosphaeria miniovina]